MNPALSTSRACVVDLTEQVLSVSAPVHNLGDYLTPIGDIDGNGVGDMLLDGEYARAGGNNMFDIPEGPDAIPKWLLLLGDDASAPQVDVVRVDLRPLMGDPPRDIGLGRMGGFTSFETTPDPVLGQVISQATDGLQFLDFSASGELRRVTTRALVSADPDHPISGPYAVRSPCAIPDRDQDGIPELLGLASFNRGQQDAISLELCLLSPSRDADEIRVRALSFPESDTTLRIESLKVVGHNSATGRAHVVALHEPEAPSPPGTDPDWGPIQEPTSLIAFSVGADGSVSDVRVVIADLVEAMGGSPEYGRRYDFSSTSLDGLSRDASHLLVATYFDRPGIWEPGYLMGDPIYPEVGKTILGFTSAAKSGRLGEFELIEDLKWARSRNPSALVAIERHNASGSVTAEYLATATDYRDGDERHPGILAHISFTCDE